MLFVAAEAPPCCCALCQRRSGRFRGMKPLAVVNLAYSWTRSIHCRSVICNCMLIVYNIPT